MLKLVLAVALLLSVIIVFVSPATDLDPTALRAAQAALALALSIASSAYLLCHRVRQEATRAGASPVSGAHCPLFDLLCSLIC